MPDIMLPEAAAPLYLMVTQGPWAGTRIPVKARQFLIGRGPDCHLRPTSADVDDQHCCIVARGTRCFLSDLNSKAGTYLNDRQILGKVELCDQDHLRVGPLHFRVHISTQVLPSHLQQG